MNDYQILTGSLLSVQLSAQLKYSRLTSFKQVYKSKIVQNILSFHHGMILVVNKTLMLITG